MTAKQELVFTPGCFDEFEGTQDELAEFIAELHRLVESGELLEKAVPIEMDDEVNIIDIPPRSLQ